MWKSMTLPAGFWKSFGPGLIWAAAAIGVSHLVQATRAGALAGFGLAGVILLALVLKYPFFEYGPRYAAATGRSLVEGYRRIGRWALWLYFTITVVTAVIHQVAIILFLAFLFQFAFGSQVPVWIIGGLVYLGSAVLLGVGRYRGFDLAVRLIVAVLSVSTLVAAVLAAPRADFSTLAIWPRSTPLQLGFVLALVGFMPSALEVSVMSSLWTLAKDRAGSHRTSVAMAQLDFRIGYVGTGILAFAFLLLGAAVMYGSGQTFGTAGAVFSTQLIQLYTSTLGPAAHTVVLVAALTAIASTVLVIIDGYPRVIDRCLQNLRRGPEPDRNAPPGRTYGIMIVGFGVLNVLGLSLFTDNLTPMIDFATIFTFATTPVYAYLNLRAIRSHDVPAEFRPGPAMLAVSYLGLVVLGGTTVVYLISRFMS